MVPEHARHRPIVAVASVAGAHGITKGTLLADLGEQPPRHAAGEDGEDDFFEQAVGVDLGGGVVHHDDLDLVGLIDLVGVPARGVNADGRLGGGAGPPSKRRVEDFQQGRGVHRTVTANIDRPGTARRAQVEASSSRVSVESPDSVPSPDRLIGEGKCRRRTASMHRSVGSSFRDASD